MATEEYRKALFKGTTYALVIGISEYEHGLKHDQTPDPNSTNQGFYNLKVADKDAMAFATFLKTSVSSPSNVQPLVNQDATAENIRQAFAELSNKCMQFKLASPEAEDPLVIVYFSGHGWPGNSEGEYYLLPYDAECDKLWNALSNKDFNLLLDKIKTNRLVVFIDACHAGAIGRPDNSKGLAGYEVKDLGEGEGRYIIASCKPNQRSWELEGGSNSIFTDHLLKLLACETNVIPYEDITTLNLFPILRERVQDTAYRQYKATQEPVIPAMTGATDIVLAKNKWVLKANAETDANRKLFKDEVCEGIKVSDYRDKWVLRGKLKNYIEGQIENKYEECYGIFDSYFGTWKKGDSVEECVKDLIFAFKGIFTGSGSGEVSQPSPRPGQIQPVSTLTQADTPVTPGNAEVSKTAKPSGDFENVPERDALGPEKPPTPTTPTQPSDQQPRWQMPRQDCVYVLQEIEASNYIYAAYTLRKTLGKPVSVTEFLDKVDEIGKDADPTLDKLLQGVVERFSKRWQNRDDI